MIPKIIHYVWVGPKPFPRDGRENLERWQKLCPDYQFRLWSEDNLDFSSRFVRQAYAAKAYNRVANYARMRALLDHGGIYLDHDIELLKPLDGLLDNRCFAGFQTLKPEVPDLVNNAVVGAEPGHPFIRSVLAALEAMDGRVNVASGSGPGLVSRLLRERGLTKPSSEIQQIDGVTLYPPRYFYPYEWTETFDPQCVTPDTVAIHRWAHLWRKQPGLTAIVKARALRLAVELAPELLFAHYRRQNRLARQAASSLGG